MYAMMNSYQAKYIYIYICICVYNDYQQRTCKVQLKYDIYMPKWSKSRAWRLLRVNRIV